MRKKNIMETITCFYAAFTMSGLYIKLLIQLKQEELHLAKTHTETAHNIVIKAVNELIRLIDPKGTLEVAKPSGYACTKVPLEELNTYASYMVDGRLHYYYIALNIPTQKPN